jgi:hypothetical protein
METGEGRRQETGDKRQEFGSSGVAECKALPRRSKNFNLKLVL